MKHQKHLPVYPWSFLLLIELREPIHVRSMTMVVDSAQQERSNWINQDPCMWRKRRYSTTSKLALVTKSLHMQRQAFFRFTGRNKKKTRGPSNYEIIWIKYAKFKNINSYIYIDLFVLFHLILSRNENIHLNEAL